MSRNGKNKGIGWWIFGGLAISALADMSIVGIGICVAAGIGLCKFVNFMRKPMDTTTHNKGDDERRQAEAERIAREEAQARAAEEARKREEAARQIPLSGDATADSIITKGVEMLETIRRENDAIPEAVLSGQMDELARKCEQIFRTLSEAPEKAPQVRKFMNYYLPTTLKMLANYRTMQNRGVSEKELLEARSTTIRGMSMILTACQKQIDNLHRENMMDISTDIDVLEQMLMRDGYMDSASSPAANTARTATEAQLRSNTPVIDFGAANSTQEYAENYFQKKAGS